MPLHQDHPPSLFTSRAREFSTPGLVAPPACRSSPPVREALLSHPETLIARRRPGRALSAIAAALGNLEGDETRARVLRWAAERYGVSISPSKSPGPRNPKGNEAVDTGHRPAGGNATPEPSFDEFVDLFDAVGPKTDVDKALTGAYWLQVVSKQASWQSGPVNNLLKDTGHGVANVTAAMRTAQAHKPALVRQISKSGKAQQARKTYRLTTSGVAHIRGKLGLTGAVPAALADHGEDEDA